MSTNAATPKGSARPRPGRRRPGEQRGGEGASPDAEHRKEQADDDPNEEALSAQAAPQSSIMG